TLIAELQRQAAAMTEAQHRSESEVQALRIENEAKVTALNAANARIAALMAEINRLTAALDRHVHDHGVQQQELAALGKRSDALRLQLEALENAKAIEIRPTPALVAPPAPVVRPLPQSRHEVRRANPNNDGDVIRRALEAIEADGAGNAGWPLPPSHG